MELLNLQWIFSGLFDAQKITYAASDTVTAQDTRTYKFIHASKQDVMDAITYLQQQGKNAEAEEMRECWKAFCDFSYRHFGEMRF